MPITSKVMVRLLTKNGYKKISQNGSHAKLFNPATNTTITVPIHSKDLEKANLK